MKRSRTQRACRVLTRNPRLKCRGIKLSVHSWRAMPIARHNKEINNANIRANICTKPNKCSGFTDFVSRERA